SFAFFLASSSDTPVVFFSSEHEGLPLAGRGRQLIPPPVRNSESSQASMHPRHPLDHGTNVPYFLHRKTEQYLDRRQRRGWGARSAIASTRTILRGCPLVTR